MLYVTTKDDIDFPRHVGEFIPFHYSNVIKIQADGDELQRCCDILGRQLPNNRVYTFVGVNAQEIAANWG